MNEGAHVHKQNTCLYWKSMKLMSVCEVAHVSMCTAAAQGSLQDGGSYTLLVNDNFPVEVAF